MFALLIEQSIKLNSPTKKALRFSATLLLDATPRLAIIIVTFYLPCALASAFTNSPKHQAKLLPLRAATNQFVPLVGKKCVVHHDDYTSPRPIETV
jgi:hypothetical protein